MQEDGTIRVGDQLLEVQGESVKGKDFDEVREEGGGETATADTFGRFHWPIEFFRRPICRYLLRSFSSRSLRSVVLVSIFWSRLRQGAYLTTISPCVRYDWLSV